MNAYLEFERELARKGHGWVVPTSSGVKARCGGPYLCSKCRADAERLSALARGEKCAPMDE